MKLDSSYFFRSVFVLVIEWNDISPNFWKCFHVACVMKPLKKVANGGTAYVLQCCRGTTYVLQCCTHTAVIVGVRGHRRTKAALPQWEEPPVPIE